MTTLTVTRGLPGSGKTTWARTQPGWRVNRDDLRAMFRPDWKHGDEHDETACTAVQYAAIRELLRDRYVIVDDTNLHDEHLLALESIARVAGADFVIVDFTDVPLETCIARDAARPNPVGEAAIRRMWDRYLAREAARVADSPRETGAAAEPKSWPPAWTLKPADGDPHDAESLDGCKGIGWDLSFGFRLNVAHAAPDDASSPLTIGAHYSDADLARGFVQREVTPTQLEKFAHLLAALARKHRHRAPHKLPVCAECGHRHRWGGECADHSWRDDCPYDADANCENGRGDA